MCVRRRLKSCACAVVEMKMAVSYVVRHHANKFGSSRGYYVQFKATLLSEGSILSFLFVTCYTPLVVASGLLLSSEAFELELVLDFTPSSVLTVFPLLLS